MWQVMQAGGKEGLWEVPRGHNPLQASENVRMLKKNPCKGKRFMSQDERGRVETAVIWK